MLARPGGAPLPGGREHAAALRLNREDNGALPTGIQPDAGPTKAGDRVIAAPIGTRERDPGSARRQRGRGRGLLGVERDDGTLAALPTSDIGCLLDSVYTPPALRSGKGWRGGIMGASAHLRQDPSTRCLWQRRTIHSGHDASRQRLSVAQRCTRPNELRERALLLLPERGGPRWAPHGE
jgi:hypothetical protein